MPRFRSLLAAGVIALALPAAALADPAELDPAFGTGGVALSSGWPSAPVSGAPRGEAAIA